MDDMKSLIRSVVIKSIGENQGKWYAPIAVSNRHVHINASDLKRLFGYGHRLNQLRELFQPGQYACDETVTLIGSKGSIKGVRVVGPVRGDTQVEISITDSIKLGVEPVIRMSGDIRGTPGIKLAGPAGEIIIPCGVIVAARHLHISEEESEIFGVKNGDSIFVRKSGIRETVFGNVIVRSGKEHRLEVHIDTDEANSASIKSGDLVLLEKNLNQENL